MNFSAEEIEKPEFHKASDDELRSVIAVWGSDIMAAQNFAGGTCGCCREPFDHNTPGVRWFRLTWSDS